jgi:hypothetical protein
MGGGIMSILWIIPLIIGYVLGVVFMGRFLELSEVDNVF